MKKLNEMVEGEKMVVHALVAGVSQPRSSGGTIYIIPTDDGCMHSIHAAFIKDPQSREQVLNKYLGHMASISVVSEGNRITCTKLKLEEDMVFKSSLPTISAMKNLQNNKESIIVGGLLTDVQPKTSRNGRLYAMLTVSVRRLKIRQCTRSVCK